MKHYETVFILSPTLLSQEVKLSIDKYRSFLLDHQATIIYEEKIGLKPLSYTIKHKNSGIYHLIEFVSNGSLVKELEITYTRDENILRFLTSRLDKYALAYNEKIRKFSTDK